MSEEKVRCKYCDGEVVYANAGGRVSLMCKNCGATAFLPDFVKTEADPQGSATLDRTALNKLGLEYRTSKLEG